MHYIKLPTGQEIRAIEYLAKSGLKVHLQTLRALTIDTLMEHCISMQYDPDTQINQVVAPDKVLLGAYGVNCKDFALIGIMYALSNNIPYEIIESVDHVYVVIGGVDFDPVKILSEES